MYEIYHENQFIHNLYRMDRFRYTHISNYLDKSTVWHSFYVDFLRFHLKGSFVTKTKDFQDWCVANYWAWNLKSSLDAQCDKIHTIMEREGKLPLLKISDLTGDGRGDLFLFKFARWRKGDLLYHFTQPTSNANPKVQNNNYE